MDHRFAVLFTVYFYEKQVDDKYEMIHSNGLIFADSYAHAAAIIEQEYPEAEKMTIELYDNCVIIPDDKMETMREILEY